LSQNLQKKYHAKYAYLRKYVYYVYNVYRNYNNVQKQNIIVKFKKKVRLKLTITNTIICKLHDDNKLTIMTNWPAEVSAIEVITWGTCDEARADIGLMNVPWVAAAISAAWCCWCWWCMICCKQNKVHTHYYPQLWKDSNFHCTQRDQESSHS